MPPQLIRRARVFAAEKGISLNALIQKNLTRTVGAGEDYREAGEYILRAARRGSYRIEKRSWRRSDLYD